MIDIYATTPEDLASFDLDKWQSFNEQLCAEYESFLDVVGRPPHHSNTKFIEVLDVILANFPELPHRENLDRFWGPTTIGFDLPRAKFVLDLATDESFDIAFCDDAKWRGVLRDVSYDGVVGIEFPVICAGFDNPYDLLALVLLTPNPMKQLEEKYGIR